MGKIVNLHEYRIRTTEKRAFGPWRKRFGVKYGNHTRLADLSDRTLYLLALPGEDSTTAFYELIMGTLGLGHAAGFSALEKVLKMAVVDIHLFLADQVRFEMMRRLGWLGSLPCSGHRMIEMVQSFEDVRSFSMSNPPQLAASHPEYETYLRLHRKDKESFIRRMLPGAIEVFKARVRKQPS